MWRDRDSYRQDCLAIGLEWGKNGDFTGYIFEVYLCSCLIVSEIYYYARSALFLALKWFEDGIADIRATFDCRPYCVVETPVEEQIRMFFADSDQLANVASQWLSKWVIHGIVIVIRRQIPDHAVSHAIVHRIEVAWTFAENCGCQFGKRVTENCRIHIDSAQAHIGDIDVREYAIEKYL